MDYNYIISQYLWVIIIGIIVIMAIIGFVAEKTNFLNKNKKTKIKEEPQVMDVPKKEEKLVDLNTTPLYDAVKKAALDERVSNKEENIFSKDTSSEIPQELYAPVENNKNIQEMHPTIEDIPEELYAPIDSATDITLEQNDNKTVAQPNDDIDDEETQNINDDIWKF